jgi:hypothetical protein
MNITIINVKEFGAVGDGKTDDTEAIQKALDTASDAVLICQDTYDIPYPDGIPSRCGYHFHETGPEVYFPAGHYIISSTLLPRKTTALRGAGHPWIEQKDNDKDIIYCDDSLRQSFECITFQGGKIHLNLGNNNEDNGLVRIEDCKFYGSKSVAIQMRENSASTMLLVLRCQIVGCEQAIVTHTDFTHIREGWLTGGCSGDGAQIVCATPNSEMTVSNLCCVPMVNGYNQRWIDNYGSLVCRNVRFGGEEGGYTPIINFAKYKPVASTSRDPVVIIDGCVDVCAWGNAKRRCLVYCEEIPNSIIIQNCGLKGIPPIMVSENIDPTSYFNAKPGMLQFRFEGNMGELSNEIPEILKNPQITLPAGPKRLSKSETALALSNAKSRWKKSQPTIKIDQPLQFAGHQQQTLSEDYIEFSPVDYQWSLDDFMDGGTNKCSLYYEIDPLPNGVMVMRKADGGCAHILIRDVEINLDQFPYLTWNMISTGSPANLTVIVIDKESGRSISVELAKGDVSGYRAYNLRALLNSGGKHTFDIKLYYQGVRWDKGKRTNGLKGQPGDYIVIPFVRAEKS